MYWIGRKVGRALCSEDRDRHKASGGAKDRRSERERARACVAAAIPMHERICVRIRENGPAATKHPAHTPFGSSVRRVRTA